MHSKPQRIDRLVMLNSRKDKTPTSDKMELNLAAAEVEGTRKAHSRTANMRCFFDPTANKTPKENRARNSTDNCHAH